MKDIRIQVKNEADLKKVCEHITVCLILHNLMIDFADDWSDDVDLEEEEEEDDGEAGDDEEEMSGQQLRAQVRNELLMWHYNLHRN